MPFCSQCGHTVQNQDRFCALCGVAQPGTSASFAAGSQRGAWSGSNMGGRQDWLDTVTPRTASVLCYAPVIGWIASIIVLATSRYRNDLNVRFHAFQALYLQLVHLLVQVTIKPIFQNMNGPIMRIDELVLAVIFGAQIFMMVKAGKDEHYRLPVLGELADRSSQES